MGERHAFDGDVAPVFFGPEFDTGIALQRHQRFELEQRHLTSLLGLVRIKARFPADHVAIAFDALAFDQRDLGHLAHRQEGPRRNMEVADDAGPARHDRAAAGCLDGIEHQVSSLLAISGATDVAIAVISAQAIRNSETGQVAPPAQVISEAAISGLSPPLKAAPT